MSRAHATFASVILVGGITFSTSTTFSTTFSTTTGFSTVWVTTVSLGGALYANTLSLGT